MNDQTMDVAIERKIDRDRTALIPIGQSPGEPYGIRFRDVGEIMEWAKLMAVDPTMPKHLQNRPATCLHVISDAIGWRMDPFKVALMSFVVNGTLCYMAQMTTAVINVRAPIKGRIKYGYEGEGEKRRCRATAKCAEDDEVVDYLTPEIGKINPKNSPLWKNDPDQQLAYYAGRGLCRRYFPEVLLGTYFRDEMADNPKVVEHADYQRIENPLGGPDHHDAQDAPAEAVDASVAESGGGQPPEEKTHQRSNSAGKKASRKQTRPDGGAAAEGRQESGPPGNDAVSGASAPPRPSETADRFPEPWVKRTPDEYVAYAAAWIERQTDKAAARERWDRERPIRNSLGSALEPAQVKQLQDMLGKVGSS